MLTAGDLTPDLERVVEAMQADAYRHRMKWDDQKRLRCECGEGPFVATLTTGGHVEWQRHFDRSQLRAALAVRAQCGTCGGTGRVWVDMLPSYYEPCSDCSGSGGAPLPVLVPSVRLEQMGWTVEPDAANAQLAAAGVQLFDGRPFATANAPYLASALPVYRLRETTEDGEG